MKRLIIFAVMLFAVTSSAEAQGWLDAVKKVATDVVDSATGGKLTAKAIIGTWGYKAPATRLDSGNILSNAGGAVAASAIESKMKTAFEKVGVKEGFCSITFNDDGTFSLPTKAKTVSGTYEFDPETHAIVFHTGKGGGSGFTGYAYISGSDLQIVFPADKLVDLATFIGSKISALSAVTSLLKNVENAYIGLAFAK